MGVVVRGYVLPDFSILPGAVLLARRAKLRSFLVRASWQMNSVKEKNSGKTASVFIFVPRAM